MKKVIALIMAVAIIASLCCVNVFAGTTAYADPDLIYSIKFMITNGGATQSEKGGQAGIGDKTAAEDEVIKVTDLWLGFPEGTVEKIGVMLDPGTEKESAPIWLAEGFEVTTDTNIISKAGDKAVRVPAFDVDTSTFPAGSYKMIFIAQVDGDIYAIGYKTPTGVTPSYGDDVFTTDVSSTGANYVEPPKEPENPGTGDAFSAIAVLAVAAIALVVLKKKAF